MPAYQGKAGQLLGGSRLHRAARGMEQATAVIQVQLGNIQVAKIALIVPDAQIDARDLDVGV